jgi:hypothetical protein
LLRQVYNTFKRKEASAMDEKQNEYEQQDQNTEAVESETAKVAKQCCCDYLKWSVKSACKMCECIVACM